MRQGEKERHALCTCEIVPEPGRLEGGTQLDGMGATLAERSVTLAGWGEASALRVPLPPQHSRDSPPQFSLCLSFIISPTGITDDDSSFSLPCHHWPIAQLMSRVNPFSNISPDFARRHGLKVASIASLLKLEASQPSQTLKSTFRTDNGGIQH